MEAGGRRRRTPRAGGDDAPDERAADRLTELSSDRVARFYRALVESLPDAFVVVVDRGLRIVFAAGAGLESGAWSRDELVGRQIEEVVSAPVAARWRERYERALAGEPQSFDYPGGRVERDLWMQVVPVRDEAGEVEAALLIAQDVTQRRALDAQLRDAQKLESLGILAGGVAHDFNNILVGVLGNASIMLERLPTESPLRANAESIILAAERASTLTQQMLAYAGKGRFVIEDVDLCAVVGEMDQLLGSSLSRRAALSLELADDPPRVRGDAGQLRQVVMNLLTNAVEALDGGPGEVRVTVRAVAAGRALLDDHGGAGLAEGPYLLLEVSDTGLGMDEATVARIFEPFFTTKFAGRGLGLAATLGIVRAHGGALKVTSVPGAGTTFRLLLPTVGAGDDDGSATGTPAEAPGGLVLIVDDDPTVAAVARDILVSGGYDALTATDGAEALELVGGRDGGIAAILLDVMMPGLDCEQIVAAVRRVSDVPIVLSSGYDQQVLSPRLVADESATFIQKPYRSNDLRRAIAEAIARRR